MKLIAAVDENWGIGRGNNLLISIPRDMKYSSYIKQGLS